VASWAGALVLLARVSSRGLDAVMPVGGERGAAARPSPLVRLFSGAAAEEVLGLVRDKPAFTLNVLVPAMALVFHMWLMPEEVATPRSLAGVAVLLGAMIAGSAALSLPRMGESVWLLFSVARPVERLVLERAAVWCGFGMLAALGALGLLAARGGAVLPEQRGAAAVILLGIPALTLGSAALGILGTDASAGDSHRRLRPEESVNQLVLVMVLGAAAFIPATGTRVKLLLLFMAIGAALWQRAKRHLPFVLDPAARGVRPIDAADGLKAMLAFFALQVLLFMGFREAVWGGKPLHPAWVVNLSLLFAGLMAIAVTVDPLVKQGLPLRGVLPLWAGRASPARLLAGAGVGIVALVLALGYLALLQERLGGPLPESWRPRVLLEALRHPIARVAATVVLAPVIEEIIFRGLLFRGIQQALGTRAAVLLSALGFALVHPEPSFGAVFGLGALAAWIYDRTGLLSASMLAHAVYNGLLILGAG
jgi:membrane protease YdiL (CAAX protease family)